MGSDCFLVILSYQVDVTEVVVVVGGSSLEVGHSAVFGARCALHAVSVTVGTDHERVTVIVVKTITGAGI